MVFPYLIGVLVGIIMAAWVLRRVMLDWTARKSMYAPCVLRMGEPAFFRSFC